MTLSEMKSTIPDYAKDLRLNLDAVLAETGAPSEEVRKAAGAYFRTLLVRR